MVSVNAQPDLQKTSRQATRAELRLIRQPDSIASQAGFMVFAGLLSAALLMGMSKAIQDNSYLLTVICAAPLLILLPLLVILPFKITTEVLCTLIKPPFGLVERWDLTLSRAWILHIPLDPDIDSDSVPPPVLKGLKDTKPYWQVFLLELTDGRLISFSEADLLFPLKSRLKLNSNQLCMICRDEAGTAPRVILSLTEEQSQTANTNQPFSPVHIENTRLAHWISTGLTEHQPDDLPLWILKAIGREPKP
jgi:hypothetical protein